MTRNKKNTKQRRTQATTNSAKGKLLSNNQVRTAPNFKTSGGVQFNTVTPLPRTYLKFADTVPLRVRASMNLTNTADGIMKRVLVIAPRTYATPGYTGLGDIVPLLVGMSPSYARFMITRVSATIVPTTPTTEGGYVAIGYEPDNTSDSGPPNTLMDVTTAHHSDVAQVTECASIALNPAIYFNDWRLVEDNAGGTDSMQEAGVIQLWSTNSRANSTGVGILQIEVDFHFAGLRSLT